jgi:hypothetical protein
MLRTIRFYTGKPSVSFPYKHVYERRIDPIQITSRFSMGSICMNPPRQVSVWLCIRSKELPHGDYAGSMRNMSRVSGIHLALVVKFAVRFRC